MGRRHVYYLPALREYAQASNRPAVDVYRDKHSWLVKCDLAGVRRGDVRVAVEGHRLTISGVRRDWSIVEGHRSYSMEIWYDHFERSVEMPCDLTRAEIRMDYRDGMLLITVGTEG